MRPVRGAASADPEVRDVFEAIAAERRIGADHVLDDLIAKGARLRDGLDLGSGGGHPVGAHLLWASSISWSIAGAGLSERFEAWLAGLDRPRAAALTRWSQTTIEQIIAAIRAWLAGSVYGRTDPGRVDEHELAVAVDGIPFFVASPVQTRTFSRSTAGMSSSTHSCSRRGRCRLHGSPRFPDGTSSCSNAYQARTMSIATLGMAELPTRMAAVTRQLHAGPGSRDHFDMFRVTERYLALADQRGVAIPAGFRDHLGRSRGSRQRSPPVRPDRPVSQ